MKAHENEIIVPIPDDLLRLFREFPEYIPEFQIELNKIAVNFPENLPNVGAKYIKLRGELIDILLKYERKAKEELGNV